MSAREGPFNGACSHFRNGCASSSDSLDILVYEAAKEAVLIASASRTSERPLRRLPPYGPHLSHYLLSAIRVRALKVPLELGQSSLLLRSSEEACRQCLQMLGWDK